MSSGATSYYKNYLRKRALSFCTDFMIFLGARREGRAAKERVGYEEELLNRRSASPNLL